MKLISYNDPQIDVQQPRTGVIKKNFVYDISDEFNDIASIIESGEEGLKKINQMINLSDTKFSCSDLKDKQLLAPLSTLKRNILCVGWNYLEHFNEREQKHIDLPLKPTIFTKSTGTIAGPYEEIPLPENYTNKFDYEAELAVIIGKQGKNIKEEEAENHIFGYMCANDLSARDVQHNHGGQWFMGKSLDKSCPTGPCLVTKDEIKDMQNLNITCKVNNVIVQSSNTNLMIFSIQSIISEISKAMTLEKGDIILTGTPPGIGAKRNPPLLLKNGDIVKVEIDKIGFIENVIINEKELYNYDRN